jgi:hypothetical protein
VGGGAVELAARGGERPLRCKEVGGHCGVGCVVVVRGDREHAAREVVDLRAQRGQLGAIGVLSGRGHAGALHRRDGAVAME